MTTESKTRIYKICVRQNAEIIIREIERKRRKRNDDIIDRARIIKRTAKICLSHRQLPCDLNFLTTFFYCLSGVNFAGRLKETPTSSSFVRWVRVHLF